MNHASTNHACSIGQFDVLASMELAPTSGHRNAALLESWSPERSAVDADGNRASREMRDAIVIRGEKPKLPRLYRRDLRHPGADTGHSLSSSSNRRVTADRPLDRRLAAVLAADIADYSRLMNHNEEDAHRRVTAIRYAHIDPKLAMHRGRVVKNTGDGFLAEFGSVVDAVRCALELQEAVALANADVPSEKRVVFRMGVNLGDVIVEPDDIYGDQVNIASRLERLSPPGAVLVSANVREVIGDCLDLDFSYLGRRELKGIRRPVGIFLLSPNGHSFVHSRASTSKPAPRTSRWWGAAAALAAVSSFLSVAASWVGKLKARRSMQSA